jgi:hypothetical protein
MSRALIAGILSQQAAPAGGGITFVDSDVNHTDPGTSLSLSFTCAEDDYALIYARSDESGSINVISINGGGWTTIDNQNPTSGRDRVEYLFGRVMDGTETSVTVDYTVSEQISASIHIFRGVDTTTPLDVTQVFDSGANDATPTNPAITPTTANGCLVLFSGQTVNDVTTPGLPTTPSGLTLGETVYGASTSNHRGQCTAYKLDYGAAATITPTAWTHTVSSPSVAEYSSWTVALRPA